MIRNPMKRLSYISLQATQASLVAPIGQILWINSTFGGSNSESSIPHVLHDIFVKRMSRRKAGVGKN